AVAAGVRRIEAVTGKMAEDFINHELDLLQDIKSGFKNPKDLQKSIENLMDENTSLKKKLELLENKRLEALSKELLQKSTSVNGANLIGEVVQVSSVDALRKLCFNFKDHFDNNYVAVLCANIEGKAAVAIGLSENIIVTKGLDAAKIIKEIISPLIKGGGGGQKALATAGGQDVSNFEKVIAEVKSLL
ncbi:MAG TPA: DHHA1 domain-containing protein, partial [Chitinophagaceae bacterium]